MGVGTSKVSASPKIIFATTHALYAMLKNNRIFIEKKNLFIDY